MDSKKMRKITENIVDATNNVLTNYDYKEAGYSVTYNEDGSSFSIKIKCETTNTDLLESKNKREFSELCTYYGFTEDDYNSIVDDHEHIMHFIGIKPNARKNSCILVDDKTGKQYVAPIEYVKMYKK